MALATTGLTLWNTKPKLNAKALILYLASRASGCVKKEGKYSRNQARYSFRKPKMGGELLMEKSISG